MPLVEVCEARMRPFPHAQRQFLRRLERCREWEEQTGQTYTYGTYIYCEHHTRHTVAALTHDDDYNGADDLNDDNHGDDDGDDDDDVHSRNVQCMVDAKPGAPLRSRSTRGVSTRLL